MARQKINMNSFIGNNNGRLVPGAGYWDSCNDTALSSTGILSANCKNKSGKRVKTSFDIKKVLVWKQGRITKK